MGSSTNCIRKIFHYKKTWARYDQRCILVFTLGTVFTFYNWLYITLENDNVVKSPFSQYFLWLNPLKPNDTCRGRTASLTSKRCILYIYSTNIDIEYFKHSMYSPFFPFQNAVCFIILTYLFPVLLTFYILVVLKLKKKIIPSPKG